MTIRAELNRLAGTKNLEPTAAANVWAGTTGKELVGALNVKAGTTGLGEDAVLRRLGLKPPLPPQTPVERQPRRPPKPPQVFPPTPPFVPLIRPDFSGPEFGGHVQVRRTSPSPLNPPISLTEAERAIVRGTLIESLRGHGEIKMKFEPPNADS